MVALVLFLSFVGLLLFGVPIAIALGVAALAAMITDGLHMMLLPMQMYSNIARFLLLAIPFFILAGNIMTKSGISGRLINLVEKCAGHHKGGLAIVAVLAALFFSAMSGSGHATVAALGVVLIPAMMSRGYGDTMPAALLASSGALGIITPPSIALVVFGSISGTSIADLFIGGIVPGVLMAIVLMGAALILCRKLNIPALPKATAKERWIAFKDAIWGIMMPIIILGGIYGGFFTPTEAAAVAAVYGLFVGIFIYRCIKIKEFIEIMINSAKGTAVVMLIVACASLFAWFAQTSGISAQISNLLITVSGGNLIVFLLMVNVILLVIGTVIDANSAMFIFVPIMLPVAVYLGYDPVAFGLLMVVNLAIGLFTPPAGVNLFVACGISGNNLMQISKAVLPFIVASLITLLLITFMPQFTTLLFIR